MSTQQWRRREDVDRTILGKAMRGFFGINKFPARSSERCEMGTVEYHHPHFTRRGWH